ncbi:hypothetical protein KI387_012555, partial [Taxus chinensis]
PATLARDAALLQCIEVVPYKLSESQRVACDRPLTLDDLKEAALHMASDKAPGVD